MERDSDFGRLLVAYHEAGHWVAHYVFGHGAEDSVISVRPEPELGRLGYVSMRGHEMADEGWFDRDC